MLRRVCVFCPASEVTPVEFTGPVAGVARLLADNGLTLVYGGETSGPPGTLAELVIQAGGRVIGVTAPGGAGGVHPGLTEQRIVSSEVEQQREFVELADAFVVLPGGLPSLEHAFQIWSWGSAAGHQKPVGLLNEGDYFTGLLKTAPDAALDRFAQESQRGMLVVSKNADDLLRRLADFSPPETRRSAGAGWH